ncbi:MAG TPA: cysteine desulfurase family protein [Thermoanaerobaculia bacterium]|nr:cysteine desulfurase family protein [Thermoanaerobaculia bacterium]
MRLATKTHDGKQGEVDQFSHRVNSIRTFRPSSTWVAEAAGPRRQVVTTMIEHPGTAEPCAWLERHGWRVTCASVDSNGVTRIDDVRAALSADTALVTVMHSNSETGVLQPVAEIAELAKTNGAVIHTDAAQSIGKVPVNVRELGVDLLSLAGHKVNAPKGVGALHVRRGTRLFTLTVGAGHERGLRPGTENVAAIVGLGAALERVASDLELAAVRLQDLRVALWKGLRARIPGLVLNGHPDLRLPNTLNVQVPGTSARSLLQAVPEIAASAGSACHAGEDLTSRVLTTMGIAPDDAIRSIRLTVGRHTTKDEILYATEALARAWATTHQSRMRQPLILLHRRVKGRETRRW